MSGKRDICIYIYENTDCMSSEERLCQTAEDYYASAENDLAGIGDSSRTVKPIQNESLRVAKTDRGKPYFPDYPDLFCSVSHSGAWWVCVLSSAEVGLDIQEHTRLRNESADEAVVRLRKMAHRFFHPAEAEYVEQADCYERFFRVWAAKESYAKYTGRGIDASFSKVNVLPEDEKFWPICDMKMYSVTGEAAVMCWQAQECQFYAVDLLEDYTMCVCAKEKALSIITKRI